MNYFSCKTVDDFIEMMNSITSNDQPVYVYQSDDREEDYLVSDKELDTPQLEIETLRSKLNAEKEIENDDWLSEDDLDELSDWYIGL